MQIKCMCHMRSEMFTTENTGLNGESTCRQVFFTFLEKYTAYIPDESMFLQNFSNHPSYETVS